MNENIPLLSTDPKPKKNPAPRWFLTAGIFVLSWILSSLNICAEFEERMSGSEFVIGEPSPYTVFSSIEFSYENKPATQRLRDETAKACEPVYRLQKDLEKSDLKALDDFFASIELFEKQKGS